MCGPTLGHFISISSGMVKGDLWTKDSPITQEIPRVFEGLCLEPGTKTRYILFYLTYTINGSYYLKKQVVGYKNNKSIKIRKKKNQKHYKRRNTRGEKEGAVKLIQAWMTKQTETGISRQTKRRLRVNLALAKLKLVAMTRDFKWTLDRRRMWAQWLGRSQPESVVRVFHGDKICPHPQHTHKKAITTQRRISANGVT